MVALSVCVWLMQTVKMDEGELDTTLTDNADTASLAAENTTVAVYEEMEEINNDYHVCSVIF